MTTATEVTPDVRTRRARWIADLRSDQYNQGNGQLFEATFPRTDDRKCKFCCIGLALANPESISEEVAKEYRIGTEEFGIWPDVTYRSIHSLYEDSDFDGEYDGEEAYSAFRDYFGITKKLQSRLIAMNDGTRLTKSGNMHSIPRNEPLVRHTNARRDFKFIARFLEIVFGIGGHE